MNRKVGSESPIVDPHSKVHTKIIATHLFTNTIYKFRQNYNLELCDQMSVPEGRVKDAWLVKVQMEPVMEPPWPGL